ncbi:MAG TPA: ABC transporter permease [Acetobacteraceae bacterium]|nr:ABC transporter permease [Acetobacteraceae bacterium]
MSGGTAEFRRRAWVDANLLQLLLLTAAIFALMCALVSDKFLRLYNFDSLTYIAPELGLLALAMMVAMLTGGIDLSVIGIANLSGILAGLFFHAVGGARGPELTGLPVGTVAAGVAIALLTGVASGVANGLLIAQGRITPILATIGSGQVFTGLCLVLTGGPAMVGYPSWWHAIGNGRFLGLAVPLWVFLGIAALVWLVLSRTVFGVTLSLIGTNAKAAVFAGLRTRRALLVSYVLTGVLASVAGILLSARTNAAKSDYGVSYLLQAVLIAVLAGTNPAGGRGSVPAVALALVALMLLSSGFQLMRFSNFLVDFIWGGFLLLVIAVNALRSQAR